MRGGFGAFLLHCVEVARLEAQCATHAVEDNGGHGAPLTSGHDIKRRVLLEQFGLLAKLVQTTVGDGEQAY